MIKLAGMCLVVLCSSMTGIYMASGLSGRAQTIETTLALLLHLQTRLAYLQPSTGELIESACAVPKLAKLAFLSNCRDAMRAGEPFPCAWRACLARLPCGLGEEERALLLPLADVLGATDLDGQLTTLAYTHEQMRPRLAKARADYEKYHKLYGTLGVLAGVAVAVVLL